jgi:hypothetical protein
VLVFLAALALGLGRLLPINHEDFQVLELWKVTDELLLGIWTVELQPVASQLERLQSMKIL